MKIFKQTFFLILLTFCFVANGFTLNILAYDADGRAQGAADLLVYNGDDLQYLETSVFIDGKATFTLEKGRYMISMIYTETQFNYIKKIDNIIVDQDIVLNIPFERGEIRVLTGNRKAKFTLIHNKGETIDRYTFEDKETILVPPGKYTIITKNPYTGKSFETDLTIGDMKIVEIVLTEEQDGNIYKFFNRCPGCGKEFKGKGVFV